MFRNSCFMFTGSLHIIHASSSSSFTSMKYMLSTMRKVMSTAELKSLLEKRQRECLWSDMKDKEVLEKIIEFWSERNSLPVWREFAHLCYLLQPTSASVERVFSMLKYIYTDQQSLSMVDLIKTTLMLRYNKD